MGSGWSLSKQLKTTIAIGLFLLSLSTIVFAQQGVQINVDPGSGEDVIGDAGNEPTLSQSPVDPDVLVCGWREFETISSSSRKAGFAYSYDGGLTWTNGGTLTQPPGFPSNTQQTDPVLEVDSDGVFYYWSEVFDPSFGQYVYKSYTDGMTWGTPFPVENPVTSGDKPWIAIDRTGGIGEGNVYGGWTNFDFSRVCFVRSIDGGETYSPAAAIADQASTQWMLQYAVGPDGEVYAAWRDYDDNSIYVTKSTNAQNPGTTPTFDALGPGGVNGLDVRVDSGNDPGFIDINPVGFHQIWLDVDRSSGPRRGWTYILWADSRNDGSDVYLARSTDGGFSWQTNLRVNDDPMGNGAYQWMVAMDVAPTGRIDAVWYDTRNDLSDPFPESELFYSFSVDGGSNWSPNRRISDEFDTMIGYPSQEKIGDYNQVISDSSGVNIVYAATFNGGQDIYFMRAIPMILDVNQLVPGETGTFSVTGAIPNKRTWLAGSIRGEGSTYIPQLDITLNLDEPIQVGDAQYADPDGNVSWEIDVPVKLAGRDIWFQAVQLRNASNLVATNIQ
jgi:hypothetical protein